MKGKLTTEYWVSCGGGCCKQISVGEITREKAIVALHRLGWKKTATWGYVCAQCQAPKK